MQVNSNIIKSLQAEMEYQLGNMGYTAILYESALRAQTTEPTDKRFIYLTDSFIEPAKPMLPLVVIEAEEIEGEPFELGNRAGRKFTAFLHCWGRSRGESRDIASYIQDNLRTGIPFNDYTSGSAVSYGYGSIEVLSHKPDVYAYPIPDSKRYERSIDKWHVVEFDARTKI